MEWDIRIAAAIADAIRKIEADALQTHYPDHLQVTGDCYRFDTRLRTYEVRDETNNIISGTVLTQEYVDVTSGQPTSINTPFKGDNIRG